MDVITGGSPCQDLSVAGKRAGMKHEANGDEETTRSGLFMDQIRVVKEMREHDRSTGRTGVDVRPRWMVWENVPGAFSSNHGKDFQAVLEEIVKIAEPSAPGVPLPEEGRWSKSGCIYDELGKWSVAWRVHDAQFHGVPQRRKRISLLADFGGLAAPWIMFDPQLEREAEGSDPYETEPHTGAESRSEVQPVGKSVSGNSEPGGEARQEAAGGPGAGAESAGRIGCLNPWDIQSKHINSPSGVAETLYSGERRYGGGEAYVMAEKPDTICLEGNGSRASHFGNGYSESDVMYTLNTIEQHGVLPMAASGIVSKGNGEAWLMEEKTTSVTSGGGQAGQGYPAALVSTEPAVLENQSASTDRHSISFQERAGKPGGGKGILIQDEHTGALSTLNIQHVFSLETYHCESEEDTAMTLKARDYKDPQSVYCVQPESEVKAYAFDSLASNSMKSSNPNSGCHETDVSKCLDCASVDPSKNQGGIAIVQPTMILNDQGGQQMDVSYDVTSTLRAQDHGHPPLVMSQEKELEVIPINTMVGTRETPEMRTTFGVGNPGDPQFTISAAHSHAVFAAGFSFGQSAKARSLGYQEEVSPTLRGGEGGNQKPCIVTAVPIENHPNDSRAKICEDGVVQTLSGRMGTGGNNTPLVMESVIPFDTTQITSPYNWSSPKPGDPCHPLASTAHAPAVCYGLDQQGGKGGANFTEEVCPPILSDSHGTPHAIAFTQNQREEVRDLDDLATAIQSESGTHQQTYVAVDVYNQTIDGDTTNTITAACGGTNTSGPKVMCIGNGQADIASHISEEKAQTLNCMHDQLAVYIPDVGHALKAKANCQFREDSETYVATAVDCRNATENADVNGTLQAKEQGQNLNSNNVCRTGNTVRRLTPLECERLQSFPDFWTQIGEWTDSKGKVHKEADTPRYKALGNSIALPFWYWLLNRISAQYPEDYTPTLGSLFDGIGGFPLCWETINGKGTALWASEIEEFPIAVTKKHFPEDSNDNTQD